MLHRALGELSGHVPPGVLILCGPTASGKTALAVDLAQRFGAEIVNADSRQIYRGMPIGTAAPSEKQMQDVPHHLFAILDPHERYSAARYASDAVRAVQQILARGRRVIVAGGTGFYVRALCGGAVLAPEYDPSLRARLAHETRIHEPEFLHEWLRTRDPQRAAALHAQDRYRVARALEIALAPPASRLREHAVPSLASRGIRTLKVFLQIGAADLDARIAARTQRMLESGFIEEAERLRDAVAGDALGYPQAVAYLEGLCTYEELRALLARATRRYAKRQQTWFRHEPETQWLPAPGVAQAAREMLGWV